MSCWVVNASPLIYLAQLDRLDLLRRGADEVLVPPTVLREIAAKPDPSTSRIDAALRTWLRREMPRDRKLLEVLKLELDAGEAETIALAYERMADRTVMDDLAGRRYARRLGLSLVGTLGLLLAARLRGEIRSLKSELERLRAVGFYASETLVQEVLRAAGESSKHAGHSTRIRDLESKTCVILCIESRSWSGSRPRLESDLGEVGHLRLGRQALCHVTCINTRSGTTELD